MLESLNFDEAQIQFRLICQVIMASFSYDQAALGKRDSKFGRQLTLQSGQLYIIIVSLFCLKNVMYQVLVTEVSLMEDLKTPIKYMVIWKVLRKLPR